jgi:hypothetical protein
MTGSGEQHGAANVFPESLEVLLGSMKNSEFFWAS